MAFKKIQQPSSTEERIVLAKKMVNELQVTATTLVDTMSDSSRALLSDLPSPVFVLDSKGVIREKFSWPVISKIEKSVARVIDFENGYRNAAQLEKERSAIFQKVVKDIESRNHLYNWSIDGSLKQSVHDFDQSNITASRKRTKNRFATAPIAKSKKTTAISWFPLERQEFKKSEERLKDFPLLFMEKAGLYENRERYFFSTRPQILLSSEYIMYGLKPIRMENKYDGILTLRAIYVSKKFSHLSKEKAMDIYRGQIMTSNITSRNFKIAPFLCPEKDQLPGSVFQSIPMKDRICYQVDFTVRIQIHQRPKKK